MNKQKKLIKSILEYTYVMRYDTGPYDKSKWWNECSSCGRRTEVEFKNLDNNKLKDIKHHKDCPWLLVTSNT